MSLGKRIFRDKAPFVKRNNLRWLGKTAGTSSRPSKTWQQRQADFIDQADLKKTAVDRPGALEQELVEGETHRHKIQSQHNWSARAGAQGWQSTGPGCL
jgi:hypothetical protein